MKIYRRHNCNRQHRTYATLASCIWPRAVWIAGDGPYASVAYCGRGPHAKRYTITVMLFSDPGEAERTKKAIDETGCGGGCHGNHELIQLIKPAGPAPTRPGQ